MEINRERSCSQWIISWALMTILLMVDFFSSCHVLFYRQLTKLKVNKAKGLDQTPSCMLKDGVSIIANTVTYLVNLSLSVGSMPDEWKQAKVIPLYKSGCREDMDNYRPISILPVISEMAVNVQLQKYLT